MLRAVVTLQKATLYKKLMLPEERDAFIRNGITHEQRGIEIAPWFRPLAPKREGYNCLTIDVFSKDDLLERAKNDVNIPKESHALLEEVDFVGNATEIADLVPENIHGSFDYIISSHNFEHLPNPIKFLQGCEKVLKSDGKLIMAVPDQRACFDYFRPHTTIAAWIEAYLEDRKKPTKRNIFEGQSSVAIYKSEKEQMHAFALTHDPKNIFCTSSIKVVFNRWLESNGNDSYTDVHCTVMTPSSFELLIFESNILGLSNLSIAEISPTQGCEFRVVLEKKGKKQTDETAGTIELERTRLMHLINEEKSKRLHEEKLTVAVSDTAINKTFSVTLRGRLFEKLKWIFNRHE